MDRVNLILSNELQEFVDYQVEIGNFNSASSYIESLISRAKAGSEHIETLLVEGLDGGDAIPLDSDEWIRMRGEVRERLSRGR